MQAFTFRSPPTVDAAAALLSASEDAKLIAGGMTLLPAMKARLSAPSDLIDLSAIPGLTDIVAEEGGLRVGALARHVDVERSPLVRGAIPALSHLAGVIGDPQVRNRGTLGGSVANADPAADYPAAVVGLAGVIRTNTRDIAADDFFLGMFDTALEAGEIITSIHFPRPDKAAYAKFRHPISGYAVVGVMVSTLGGQVRVGVTGAAASAFRWTAAEQALAGDLRPQAIEALVLDAGDLNDDMHAGADYRAHLVGVMTRRAVAAL